MKGFNPELNRQVEAVADLIRKRHGMSKHVAPKHRSEACRDCKEYGEIFRNSEYEVNHYASTVCPTCNGKGFVRIVIKGDKE